MLLFSNPIELLASSALYIEHTKTHQFPEIFLRSASRLLVYTLERLLSFPLCENYTSTFLLLTHLGIYLLNSIFCFSLGPLPVCFIRPQFFSFFPSTTKVRRKGICAFLLFSFLILKTATHILKILTGEMAMHDTKSKHASWRDR